MRRKVVSLLMFVAITAHAGGEPNHSTMLPETPEGWRYERIDFPLEFAPDLKYEGFEELRFAPGMFNTESETYFTYIFAIQLKGVTTVDDAFIKSFLLKYYRGLCKAVAESRKLDVDSEKVTVAVKKREDERLGRDVFHATIDTFDSFTTGKPLKLKVEVVTAPDSSRESTCLFALASPKPKKDKVWQMLYGMRNGFSCDAKPVSNKK